MEAKFLISDILIRIRLLTVRQKEPYLLFHSILGFYPKNLRLYEQAFRHKSASVRSIDGIRINNERLEFLGDAVLNVLVTDILFKKFPLLGEDFLTRSRSNIVQRRTLNKIALDLGLDKLLLTAALSSEFPHQSVYGNALEALMGAIYLDQGYRRCKQFLEKRILDEYLDLERVAQTEQNFKSALLEWCQQKRSKLVFETSEIQQANPKLARFQAIAIIDGIIVGQGQGLSKKEAQQTASKSGLEYLQSRKKD